MFTGIITHLGTCEKRTATGLTIGASSDFVRRLQAGSSVAVHGVCLTVCSVRHQSFSVDIMPETRRKTVLGDFSSGDLVNLELPMSPSSLFQGHIVQGHVDGIGNIMSIVRDGNSRVFTFFVSRQLSRYMVEKGSIAVNGISLTLISCDVSSFSVGIIPFTWDHTTLHTRTVGDRVNIEVDVIAKHIERFARHAHLFSRRAVDRVIDRKKRR